MADLFFPPPPDAAALTVAAAAHQTAHPETFATIGAAQEHLSNIVLPASGAWAYAMTTKAASSSMKRFLYELEFGQALTTDLNDPEDRNGDAATTRLLDTRLFARAHDLPDPVKALAGALRITTVRDPALRAVSAFKHLCRTHSRSEIPFYAERLHISAFTGLDWGRDSYRSAGLERFLNFVDWAYSSGRLDLIDRHWRRQTEIIQPQVFQPQITAKVEDLAPALSEIAARLGKQLPGSFVIPHANASPAATGRDLVSPAAEALIQKIYAADFAAFGY